MKDENLKVAIVGRPNVGKSRLFNRLVGKRRAVIDEFDGVTRDPVTERMKLDGKEFELVDTGGIGLDKSIALNKVVQKRAKQIIKGAQLIVFTCDVTEGVTALDKEVASILRRHPKEVILVVNKCDNPQRERGKLEFFNLGIGTPIAVSALHNRGIEELKETIYECIKDLESEGRIHVPSIKISILGRPNVGKSSFLNTLLNQEKAIVDENPGTTRDSLNIELDYKEDKFLLMDTAGVRHKSKIKRKVDAYCFKRTRESIKKSDVCLVLIDGWIGLVKDDIRIILEVLGKGKACVLVVNKWDLIEGITSHLYEEFLVSRMKKVRDLPVMFTSAKNNSNVVEAFELAKAVYNNYRQHFSTSELNKLMEEAHKAHPPPNVSGKGRLKIYYVTQVDTAPPCIKIFVNSCEYITDSYTRYLEGKIREKYYLKGVPVKLIYETSHK